MKRKITIVTMLLLTITAYSQTSRFDVNRDGYVSVSDVMSLVDAILTGKTEDLSDEEQQNLRPIKFHVSETPLVAPEGAKIGMKRASELTTNTLKMFYINMMYYHESFWWETNRSETYGITTTGQYENNNYWPSVGDNVDVYVFGYYTYYKNNVNYFYMNEGHPYLYVPTEESSDDQCDVLVAKKTDTWGNCQGDVFLNFSHICSALQFSVIKTKRLEDYTVMVNGIKLHNIKSKGKYDLLDGFWYDLNTYSNFTLKAYKNGNEESVTVSDTESYMLGKDDNDYLFLIPQDIIGMEKGTAIATADNNKEAYIEITCKIMDANDHFIVGTADNFGTVYLPFSATLTAGHIKPFTISIGTAIRDANGNRIIN